MKTGWRPAPFLALLLLGVAYGQTPPPCPQCSEWNASQQPFRVYGNTYYVGVHGLASILIAGDRGHILIDGDLAQSVPKIVASIRALGFKVEDIKLIVSSHAHYDHAGGIAQLQRLSGATVAASAWSARVLESGESGSDDPQHGVLPDIAPVSSVKVVKDGQTLHVGRLAIRAHLTPGHTPGGTTWTWKSCEQGRCLQMVYADSLTAAGAPGFHFSHNATYPGVLKDFQKSFATLSRLRCDVLLTPYPEASDLWSRFQKNEHGGGDAAFIDPTACRRYVAHAREQLAMRLASEKGQ